jgi:TDG/mug DNA glycosylase family protein
VRHRASLIGGCLNAGVGFTRAELESFRDATVDDLVGPGLRLLFVGINPGLWTAATGTHFAHPGNRFYPALRRAGIIDLDVDRGTGMTDTQRAAFVARGIGITNLVARATVRASELSRAELVSGGRRLEQFVAEHRPVVVAVAGVTAYRDAFGRRDATTGRQPETFGDAVLWVVPNPSGLNAHESLDTLAAAYRAAAIDAGIVGADA